MRGETAGSGARVARRGTGRSLPDLARGLLLMLVLVAAWNPPLPWQTPPVDLLVLIDASRSVAPAARDAAWAMVAEGARRLPAGSRVAVVRFGAQAVVELPWSDSDDPRARSVLRAATPPYTRHLDGLHTDIAAALDLALHLSAPGRATRIALISDGRATRGSTAEALQLARRAGIPVHVLAPKEVPGGDSWIESLTFPDRVRAGQTIPVALTLASAVHAEGSVTLSIDGAPYATREVALAPGRPRALHVDLPAPAAGGAVLSAQLQVAGDPEPRNDHAAQIVNVEGGARALYLTRRGGAAGLARSLREGGWDLRVADPAAPFPPLEELRPSAIVLDDIAIADLPDAAWETLVRRVTEAGTGLLVLGGAHAYGAGGYRHSRLEAILPVTAEAREPSPPAAVMFMLDTSGSMDRRDGGPSRLAVARQAVLESARRLQPGDAVGLIEFAAEPRMALPLGTHRDPHAALHDASQSAPAGGTRLAPALRMALPVLGAAAPRQKLLILVTDGHVERAIADGIAAEIARSGIDVIALAIGPDADPAALLPLTAITNGRLLNVDRIAHLPALMRRELEERRPSIASGRFTPEPGAALPFLPDSTAGLPALGSYAITRERGSASVHLHIKGDPLLAAHHAGAGRVAVLTTGLDDWPGFWADWPDSGGFVGGLLDWIDARHGANELLVRARPTGDGMTLIVDTPAVAAGDPDAELLLRTPDGRLERQRLAARAPARYEAHLTTTIPGRYRAILRVGDRQAEHEWIYGGNDEFIPSRAAAPLAEWLRSGLVQHWSPAALADGAAGDGQGVLRRPLLVATLLLYAMLLLWERRADLIRRTARRMQGTLRSVVDRLNRTGTATQ